MLDIPVPLTAEQTTLLRASIGQLQSLKNADGTPRVATLAEVVADLKAHCKNRVQDARNAAARRANTVTEFN